MKVIDVKVKLTTNGKMVIVLKYIDNCKIKTKIEPYSEELLLKYKKQYEKRKAYEAKIQKKVNMKTKEKVDINTNHFIENALSGGLLILEIVAIGTAAYIGCSTIIGELFKDFGNIKSPIISDEQVEYNIDMHK